jgi:hypothetical protein
MNTRLPYTAARASYDDGLSFEALHVLLQIEVQDPREWRMLKFIPMETLFKLSELPASGSRADRSHLVIGTAVLCGNYIGEPELKPSLQPQNTFA